MFLQNSFSATYFIVIICRTNIRYLPHKQKEKKNDICIKIIVNLHYENAYFEKKNIV